jgi:hypothetical protein
MVDPNRVPPRHVVDGRVWRRATAPVLARPWLWPTAVRQLVRVARPGWWQRAPFLPVPEPNYVRFRLETAYGRDGEPRGEDLVSYLEWCRRERARA